MKKILPFIVPLFVICLIYYFYKKITATGSLFSSNTGANAQISADQKLNDGISLQGISVSEIQLNTIAQLQYDYMRGYFGGPSQDDFRNSFDHLGANDLRGLWKTFGIRSKDLFGFLSVFTGNLGRWYTSDLSDDDLEFVKEKFAGTNLM